MELKKGYRHTEIGPIPEDWAIKELGEISIISRLAGAEYTSMWEETPNGEITALRGFNIGKNSIIERDLTYISNDLSLKLKRSRLVKGDVIYPCVGTIGNAAVIEESNKYHIQQNIARITPNKKDIESSYLANYLMSQFGAKEVARFNASSSQPSVLVSNLRQYRVPLPSSIKEQSLISNYLKRLDKLVNDLEKLIEKKKNIKQGLMQELLTGKRRLPEFAKNWDGKYKKTDVGEIPSDWDCLTLKEVSTYINDGTHHTPKYVSQGVPFYSVENVTGNNFQRTKYITMEEHQQLIKRCKPERGDILLCRIGDVGTVKYIDFDINGSIYVSLALVKIKKNYNAKYIANFMQTNTFLKLLRGRALMSAVPPKINMGDIGTTELIMPRNVEEQIKLIQVFDNIQSEINLMEDKLEKYKNLKNGMMQTLLTGEIRLV